MISFKSPQPSPSGVVLSLARALGIVSSVDDVVIVPLSEWQAMHERHEADGAALQSALVRVVEVEERDARTDEIARQRSNEIDQLNDEIDDAHRLIAARDERIKELNAWLDVHVPMVQR